MPVLISLLSTMDFVLEENEEKTPGSFISEKDIYDRSWIVSLKLVLDFLIDLSYPYCNEQKQTRSDQCSRKKDLHQFRGDSIFRSLALIIHQTIFLCKIV